MSSSQDEPLPEEKFDVLARRYQEAIDAGDFDDATAAVGEIGELAEAWCREHPSPDMELMRRANECEERGDWTGAEAAYQKMLELPGIEPHVERRAHGFLASLYHLLGRQTEALRQAALASATGRRIDDIPLSFATVLRFQAEYLLWAERLDEAEPLLAEAMLLLANDELYSQQRAAVLIDRAWHAVKCARLADAEKDLAAAFPMLEPLAAWEIAAGVHLDLSRWWAVTARLRTARGEFRSSVDAWREALRFCAHVAELPHAASVYTQFGITVLQSELAKALAAAGNHVEALEVIAERKSILERSNIPDHDLGG